MLKNKKTNKLIPVLVILALLLIVASVVLISRRHHQVPQVVTVNGQKINLTPATEADNKVINDKKSDGSLNQPTSTPQADSVNVSISRANQSADGTLQVRVLVSPVTSGTCELVMTNKASTITRTGEIVNKGTYYGCDGFDIVPADFSEGEWALQVSVTSGDLKGSATQVVTLVK